VAIRVRGKVKINLGSKIEKKVDIFLIFVFKDSAGSKSNLLSSNEEFITGKYDFIIDNISVYQLSSWNFKPQ